MTTPAPPRPSPTPGWLVPAVLLAGLLVAGALAARADVPAGDALQLLVITTIASSVCAAIGLLVLRWSGPRSMRTQTVIVGATSTAVVIAGIVAAADAMFISTHDRDVLLVVVAMAAGASMAAALRLASSFDADAASVDRLTEQLGESSTADDEPSTFRISEMERLARRLADANARLAEARVRERQIETSRRELVSWVSHDLRSPLASIRALAEALEDRVVVEDADVARYHRSIRLESERLSTLVDDLFELSRLQAGTERDRSDSVEIVELVADAIAGVEPVARAKGVRVEVDVEDISSVTVPALDVLRIVRNLVDNAVRHTPSGGTVRLEGRHDGDGVALAVLDQCGGIPEEELTRVFDVAFRGDAARLRDATTSGGLGLTIARGLAEAHSGSLDVRNLDGGCRFCVRIPSCA
jgi:signal transduction histidine kinase